MNAGPLSDERAIERALECLIEVQTGRPRSPLDAESHAHAVVILRDIVTRNRVDRLRAVPEAPQPPDAELLRRSLDMIETLFMQNGVEALDAPVEALTAELRAELGLDSAAGNVNSTEADRAMRAIHTDPPIVNGDDVSFRFYMEAPRIVDWLAGRGVEARYEQRDGEGVSIVVPAGRAFVGDHIVVTDGSARVVGATGGDS